LFAQYEVVFSDDFISDVDAKALLAGAASSWSESTGLPKDIEYKSLQSHLGDDEPTYTPTTSAQTYDLMWSEGKQFLCSTPILDSESKNETSQAEARAAEEKELARASYHGVELLQDLDGPCMYFWSDWWTYSFCHTSEVKQFHQLPLQPGKAPQEDKKIPSFILGRAKPPSDNSQDHKVNSVDIHKGHKIITTQTTEIHVKGDVKYLSQQLDDGTICDLTGSPRRVEVQYHCNPNTKDRIGYIKEVTTCSYLLVIYTPKLCKDVAFMPPQDNTTNTISCHTVVPADQLVQYQHLRTLSAQQGSFEIKSEGLITVGGTVIGGKKIVGNEGSKLPVPGSESTLSEKVADLIARSNGAADGGVVETLSDEAIKRLDLDPKYIERLREELQEMAGDKGWKLEIIEVQGDLREIRGIVDGEDEEEEVFETDKADDEVDEGTEETYKEDL
jgi:protein OS-9